MADSEWIDDPTILPNADLWRRLHPHWVVSDDNAGGVRVSSAAFDDSRDGSPLSVLLADVVAHSNRTPKNVIEDFPGYGIAAITAGFARECGKGVMRTPEPNEPAHASVFGRKTGSTKRSLARSARIINAPSG